MIRSISIVLTAVFIATFSATAREYAPVALRSEYLENPQGIDSPQPRLTWRIDSRERGQKQTAYRILVASSAELLKHGNGDLWDSGEVGNSDSVNIVYAGKALSSRDMCYWKVCSWDKDHEAVWSAPASWSMGLLRTDDWKAEYISFRDTSPVWQSRENLLLPPARQYRKEFVATKKIKRAAVYVTALGVFELYVNGERVSDQMFAPGWTDYHQRALYNTYDVTSLMTRGRNAVGAVVADGWYCGYIGFGLQNGLGTEHSGRNIYGKTPTLMAQLEIEYADGSREIVPTDTTWKVTGDGPIREADFLMGESYDATKETPDWSKSGFDDSRWESAINATDNGSVPATFYEDQNPTDPSGDPHQEGRAIDLGFKRPPILEAFAGDPVRPLAEVKPVSITARSNGVYIVDFGQNFAGVVRLKVKGPRGETVKIRYGERLYLDGRLMTANLRRARATDFYTLRGDAKGETFTPRFTYHGFQYAELSGYPGKPELRDIMGIVVHSDTPLTSDFTCSDPMDNRLFQNVLWTQLANFVDLPTDCPQRDERFGWLGDAQTYVHCATLNADVAAFYTKWLPELMESQRPSGTFPGYSPFPFQTGWDYGTAWGDAGVICPWTVWRAYDDTRIIEKCWPAMTRFMEWREKRSPNFAGLNGGNDWGDWLSFGKKTPLEYVDAVFFAWTAHLMWQMAEAVNKNDEAVKYARLYQNVKSAFDEKYVKPDGSLTVDTESAYSLALFMDLMPANLRANAGEILAGKLRAAKTAKNSGMTTGFLGTRPLLPVLTSIGENDLAATLFQSHSFPGWGYEVEQGATTIWERWNGYTKDYGFEGPDGSQNASMNSFSHYSFGAVCEWMFNDLAGIEAAAPGYAKIIIHPHPPSANSNPDHEPIHWVNAHYDCIHGRIVSNWRRTGPTFELHTVIPANTSARVCLPAINVESVREGGRVIGNNGGARLIEYVDGCAVMEVEPGTYDFKSTINNLVRP